MSSIPDSNNQNPNFSIHPVTEEMRADPCFSRFCSEAKCVFEREGTEEKTYDFVKDFMEKSFRTRGEIVKNCNQYKKWVDEISEENMKAENPASEGIDDAFFEEILQKIDLIDKVQALTRGLVRVVELQRINVFFEVFGEAAEVNSEMKEKLAYFQSLPYEERVEAAAKEFYG